MKLNMNTMIIFMEEQMILCIVLFIHISMNILNDSLLKLLQY